MRPMMAACKKEEATRDFSATWRMGLLLWVVRYLAGIHFASVCGGGLYVSMSNKSNDFFSEDRHYLLNLGHLHFDDSCRSIDSCGSKKRQENKKYENFYFWHCESSFLIVQGYNINNQAFFETFHKMTQRKHTVYISYRVLFIPCSIHEKSMFQCSVGSFLCY